MIEPLAHKVIAGQGAASELQDGLNISSRFAQWDLLRADEKWAEFDKGPASRFSDLPGFTPVWCADCSSEVFPDLRHDPEGTCPFCNGWLAHNGPDRLAA